MAPTSCFCLQFFEGKLVDGDLKTGGHILQATSGSGANRQTFNYSTGKALRRHTILILLRTAACSMPPSNTAFGTHSSPTACRSRCGQWQLWRGVPGNLLRDGGDGEQTASSISTARSPQAINQQSVFFAALVQVAIKKVLQDKRFKNRELQIMKMVDHPNIVRLKHCFYSRKFEWLSCISWQQGSTEMCSSV